MAQYLLDTHTLIWFINGDQELSTTARRSIEGNDVSNFVSIASIWEIAIKVSLGKLELKKPFAEISRQLLENGFMILPISFEDTIVISTLPFHHRDPFDRVMIAQALSNDLTIISRDAQFSFYNVKVLW